MSIDSGGHRARFFKRRDALVEAHLHLVPPIAARISRDLPPSFELDDLLSTGYLALLHVATRYRPGLHGGAPFESFAKPRVRGAILDSIRRRSWRDNTCPPLDEASEPAVDDTSTQIHTSVDEGRLRKRLAAAIRRVPAHPRTRDGKFISLAEMVACATGIPVIREHAAAVAKLRGAA